MLFVGANDGVVGRFFVACTADILQLVLNVSRCQFFHPIKRDLGYPFGIGTEQFQWIPHLLITEFQLQIY